MKAVIVGLAVALMAVTAFFAPSSHLYAASAPGVPAPTPPQRPIFAAYKGVTIGMSMLDARAKLGAPAQPSDEQDSFQISDNESAQVYYDAATHIVTAVMITYTGTLTGVPTPKDVFGEEIEVRPDGGVFKKVDYPKAGFWLSYNRTAGDDPMVIIALNKM